MKGLLISILRPVVKAIYRLIIAVKRAHRHIIASRTRIHKHSSFISRTAASADSTQHQKPRRQKKPLWKDKRFIAGVCAMIVVVTVVLSLALPGTNHTAEASTEMAAALSSAPSASDTDNKAAAGDAASPSEAADADQTAAASASGQPEPSGTEEQTAETENALDAADTSVMLSLSDAIPTTAPDATPVPTTEPDIPDLVPGCTDSRIIEVQERLMELDYMEDEEPSDYYGYGTEYALQLFQRKHNLQVDGLLGTETLTMLFSDKAQPYTVKLGDKGTDVESIQECLQGLNYLKSSNTGYFGTDTETAVKNFQSRNGLTVDGNVGEYTREVLYSEDAKPAKTVSSSSGGSSGDKGGSNDSGSSSGSGDSGSGSGDSGGSGGSDKGSGDDTSASPSPGDPDEASADALIEFAKTQLGKKYVRGGKGPNVFDCSGFVYYCLNQVGYKIKYMTSSGWGKCSLPKVSKMSDLQKGDIVCFKGHVGIYMGDGKMIDASSSQGKIRICSNIFNSSYWKKYFICGRRVF